MKNERLVLKTGPMAGKVFPVIGQVTVGRNPENTIQLDDLQVSRKHACIEHSGSGVVLRDLGSGNGTYIENRRILEYRLSPGTVIRFGTQEIVFEAEGGDEEEEEPASLSGIRFEADALENYRTTNAEEMFQTLFQSSGGVATDTELKETQRRLQAIYKANEIITSERDLNKLFVQVMEQIFSLIPAHNGMILLKDESNKWVEEHMKSRIPGTEFTVSSTIVNRAFDQKEAVITANAMNDSALDAGASIITGNIASAMCVPMLYQGSPLGVIYVDTRGTANAFVQGDLELLMALAGPSAISIRNAQYVRELKQAYDDLDRAYNDTLIVLANAIELRDHYTVGHTWRVTNFALAIAKQIGWSGKKLEEVEMGSVLHDVGKIGVDNAILSKPGKLTDEEYEKLKVHPQRGQDLLKDVKVLHPLIPYCLYHHERYDGGGYPFGLKGEDIPMEGRIVAVADTFDAMTSNRPYRKGLPPEVGIEELEKGKGTQFDPVCAQALIDCYKDGLIDQILQNYFQTDEKSIACPFCSTFIRIAESAEVGTVFDCHVCRRTIRLIEQNGVYFGELVSEADAG